ncbi:MAG: glycosyltransferase family 4 protein [Bacteroidota bacterium]
MRLLALVTDAYGGHGGIAKVNRDLFDALLADDAFDAVEVLPRVVPEADLDVPPGVVHRPEAGGGLGAFGRTLLDATAAGGYDGVFCGHLHLAPFAAVAAARAGVPWLLLIHGTEAWGPPHWPPTQGRLGTAAMTWAAKRAPAFVAVSDLTRRRFAARIGVPVERGTVVPNSVDLGAFGPGPKRPDLLERYGLEGSTVLMTLARLSAAEQYKGVDEVMEAMPALLEDLPDLAYLICGSGDDRDRLEAKAASLGLGDRVVFAGYVPEAEKADHFRLGDAFAMPGRGEGFGIVYLEALACGVPVVASSADASHEAVRDGRLGEVVDPGDQASVREGIRNALARPKGVPEGLEYFSQERFAERWRTVAREVFVR